MIMTTRRILPLCLLFLCAGTPTFAQTVAIVGARAHTMLTEAAAENVTIILHDGRIQAIGRDIEVPPHANRIDAAGYIVTPAFMNSATQLGLTEVSSVAATNDYALATGSIGAAFDIQYAINPNSLLIQQARIDGLARAITLPTGSPGAPFAGIGALLHLVPGKNVLEQSRVAMAVEVGGETAAQAGGSRSAQWLLVRNALDEAKAYRPSARPGPSRDSFLNRLDLRALKDVADGRMPLVIGANRESDIRQAIALARDYGTRIILNGGIEAWRAADELAAAQIPVILDPSINLALYYDNLGARADNAALLDRAGVMIAFKVSSIHTNFNAGFALREVAGLAVANGLAYQSALAALTINPARLWGITERCGALAPGLDADLIIWDGDPLEAVSAPVAVFMQGKEIPLVTRQTKLRDRYAPATRPNPLPPAYR